MQEIPTKVVSDHRPRVAEKKRLLTRTKLLDAAMRVYASQTGTPPVIDDVIREADVSRGTFYRYFDSLDQVLIALGQELSNQMTTDIMPIYGVLEAPWQRFAVGFRVFLLRALLDHKWAGFVTRAEAWPHHALVAACITKDLTNGQALGQFEHGRMDATIDFLMGASAHGIQALLQGMEAPQEYIDTQVHMALCSAGCDASLREQAVAFSITYLQEWASGKSGIARPVWALNMNSKEGRDFLRHKAAVSPAKA